MFPCQRSMKILARRIGNQKNCGCSRIEPKTSRCFLYPMGQTTWSLAMPSKRFRQPIRWRRRQRYGCDQTEVNEEAKRIAIKDPDLEPLSKSMEGDFQDWTNLVTCMAHLKG